MNQLAIQFFKSIMKMELLDLELMNKACIECLLIYSNKIRVKVYQPQ